MIRRHILTGLLALAMGASAAAGEPAKVPEAAAEAEEKVKAEFKVGGTEVKATKGGNRFGGFGIRGVIGVGGG